ncbi:hypothetical protein [Vibrio cincinnatiensis]|uniref:hypothetical protein n=1 Tax=Vibrio cincinnatiensis TaxID=675 RepID=UPI0013026AA7|nr:hypothetical protein [Vibrio cincinnatiensis]
MFKNIKASKLISAGVVAFAISSPVAFAEGVDVSEGLTYIAGALVAVASLGGAYLGLNTLKTVWGKITSTRV